MKWYNKLKKSLAAKSQAAKDKRVLNQYRTGGLAHQCMHCRHFQYREEKPRNWVCRCPDGELRFAGNTCLGYSFGEHPEMVVMNG